MAYPGVHTFKVIDMHSLCTSVGTSPIVVYFRIPFRCQLLKVTSVISGALTVANAACAVTVNGGSTLFTHTIIQSGSAAGQLDSTVPGAVQYFSEDDVIAITPSGATGSSIQAHFSIVIRQQ